MFSNPLPRSSPAPFSLASAGCSSRLTPHYLCKAALVSLPALWLCPMMEFGLVLVCAPLPLTGFSQSAHPGRAQMWALEGAEQMFAT